MPSSAVDPIAAADKVEPRIIPRAEHPISRKNIDREALKVLYRLRDAGHAAYLVGGGVRDLLLGKTPKDFDISTDARPGQLRKIFRNSRLIGRRFRLVQIFFHGGKIIEVATFRCRSEFEITADGQPANLEVLAANNTFGTPAEDAFRRDLTINALFYEIENFTVIDYTGGVEDLHHGIIRIVGDPDTRITRDPGRMLRVIRHAARNNFSIEPKTWEALLRHRQELALCPVSRNRDELWKDLRSGAAANWVDLAVRAGIFQVLLPCYENVLAGENASVCHRELVQNLEIVDRLHKDQRPLPDPLVLALLLLPWAKADFNLIKRFHKGPEAARFNTTLRDALDNALLPLNIKREHKAEITTLLSSLPQFIHFYENNNLPNWLKRKSYFRDCTLFYHLFREASGGSPVAPDQITALAPGKAAPAAQKQKRRRRRPAKNHAVHGPAFAAKGRGIFGLKKG